MWSLRLCFFRAVRILPISISAYDLSDDDTYESTSDRADGFLFPIYIPLAIEKGYRQGKNFEQYYH